MKYTIEKLQEIVKNRGGQCLSKKIMDYHDKLQWQCKNHHIWSASLASIVYTKSWCPICAGNTKLTIKQMQKIAEKRGGKCLSKKYINGGTKLLWQCKERHQWKSVPESIKAGSWCPICGRKKSDKNRRKYTIEKLQKIAKERGGECLAKKYKNDRIKLKWCCKDNHEWTASARNIIHNKTWCPYCIGMYKTIEDMQKIARKRGGKCLSETYKDANSRLMWQCHHSHIWEAIPNSIRRGSWCPQCRTYMIEEKCRYILEYLTDEKFPKDRKTIGDELDGYCEKLNLAFERQGEGHYFLNAFFHKNDPKKLQKIQANDRRKAKKCQKLGTGLIVVGIEIEEDNLLNYLIAQLQSFSIPIKNDPQKFNFENFWISINKLEEARKIAQKQSGECLSKEYFNAVTPLLWKCHCGHEWKAILNNIKKGHWCPRWQSHRHELKRQTDLSR